MENLNEKQQIEEMAITICRKRHACILKDDESCRKCDQHERCLYQDIAYALYQEGYRKLPDNIGDFSDGYHTFNELYHHRAVLFSVICNMMPEKAWKSKLHDTGDMFDGMFIVGIETEQGQATYHYDIDPYWDMFKVKELEKAPKWDGHTPTDAIHRIGNIKGFRKQSEGEWRQSERSKYDYFCTVCGEKAVQNVYGNHDRLFKFCPNCGAKMKGGK